MKRLAPSDDEWKRLLEAMRYAHVTGEIIWTARASENVLSDLAMDHREVSVVIRDLLESKPRIDATLESIKYKARDEGYEVNADPRYDIVIWFSCEDMAEECRKKPYYIEAKIDSRAGDEDRVAVVSAHLSSN